MYGLATPRMVQLVLTDVVEWLRTSGETFVMPESGTRTLGQLAQPVPWTRYCDLLQSGWPAGSGLRASVDDGSGRRLLGDLFIVVALAQIYGITIICVTCVWCGCVCARIHLTPCQRLAHRGA